MPNTVPNQKTIKVHREDVKGKQFLGILTENLANAYKDLNATATILYLYIANNKDGFDLAFSPRAVELELGMPQSTCRDQFKKLVKKGYLIQKSEGSSIYDFYEVPKEASDSVETPDVETNEINFEKTTTVSPSNSNTDFDF